jgi:hypothetical protein
MKSSPTSWCNGDGTKGPQIFCLPFILLVHNVHPFMTGLAENERPRYILTFAYSRNARISTSLSVNAILGSPVYKVAEEVIDRVLTSCQQLKREYLVVDAIYRIIEIILRTWYRGQVQSYSLFD